MKRLLILGGSDLQVSAIKKAKEMGLYVITCDYLPNNPGHQYSDQYLNVSTTDKEEVLKIASRLQIDGVLAYASDPGALTAAYVAEKLGLRTNLYNVVQTMSQKNLFRKYLLKHGYNVPECNCSDDINVLKEFFLNLGKKAILKPVDSSGSKGIFIISNTEQIDEYFERSIQFSKVGKVIIEEFIDKKGYQIGGDGFMLNGELVFRCFGDIHFSETNPILPCSVSVPSTHSQNIINLVHDYVGKLLKDIGMIMGAVNFDIIIDQNEKIYIIEIGARNGGNMIPELTKYCTGVDMIELSIKASIGEEIVLPTTLEEKKYFSHYVLHSKQDGVLKSIKKSKYIERKILLENLNYSDGDIVRRFRSSADRLGVLLLKYDDKQDMLNTIYKMDKHYVISF